MELPVVTTISIKAVELVVDYDQYHALWMLVVTTISIKAIVLVVIISMKVTYLWLYCYPGAGGDYYQVSRLYGAGYYPGAGGDFY